MRPDHLLYRAVVPVFYLRVRRFLHGARRGAAVQREVLWQKIRRQASSDFGRDHGFADMRTLEDFRRRIPIRNYEYYRPYVERVKRGELQAMFAPGTRLLMFAMTSGTTNQSKYIPVTAEFFAEYRRSWQTWGAANYSDHTDQVRKKTVQLSSNWRQLSTPAGIPAGNISGLAAETAPFIARRVFLVPLPVIRIDNAAAKHYAILRVTMASRSVGMIVTANPSTLIEFARRAHQERESLIRDIYNGTLSEAYDIPGNVRSQLRRFISQKNPGRARELTRIADHQGTLYPKDFWPQLNHLAVWMGGSVGAYLSQLEEFYGTTTLRDHGLSASEGRMTIPLADHSSAGVLDYVHHYYEFIPVDEMDSSQPTVLEAHELEVGKDYFILLSTSGGLYRYDIHDVVRCVEYEGQVPVLQFLNKGAHFSSITGEKLSEFQVVSAVKQTLADLQLALEHFTVAPIMEGTRPGYVLLVEGSDPARDNERLARRVEQRLMQLNCEYADKLASGRLVPLSVRQLEPGTWYRFRHQRTSARGNLEEYKHPCLVGDLQFVDRLVKG